MFSGLDAENEEHIIPRWLQRKFKLHQQKYYLPNGTKLKYKLCKIPVRREDNSLFGNIENNIARGIYNPMELYLWAFKIHIGLIYRSAYLQNDITNPESDSILKVGDFSSEVNFFRMLYKTWKNKGTFDPDPIGSVFLHENPLPNMDFDLIHNLITGTVSINLGKKFLTVFLWDKGRALNTNIQEIWDNHHLPFIARQKKEDQKEVAYFARRVWSFESSMQMLKVREGISTISTGTMFTIIPPLTTLPPKVLSEELYRKVSPSFGLQIGDFNGGLSIMYQPFNRK